jgi:hypothetical protein
VIDATLPQVQLIVWFALLTGIWSGWSLRRAVEAIRRRDYWSWLVQVVIFLFGIGTIFWFTT